MDQRIQPTAKMSLEDETLALLTELEQTLTEILASNPDNDAVRSRLTLLLAYTSRVRQRFSPLWNYLKDPPPSLSRPIRRA